MADNPYQQALEAAKKELAQLVIQKDEIDKRVARLRQTVASLTALTEEINPEDGEIYVPSGLERAHQLAVKAVTVSMFGKNMGFTDVVREVLKAADEPMTTIDVRDGLVRMGINLGAKYTNPLAVISKTLQRLLESKEVRSASKNGKKAYQWNKTTSPLEEKG